MLGEGLGGRHDSGETLACLANDYLDVDGTVCYVGDSLFEIRPDKTYAVGLKFEVVVHVEACSQCEAEHLAKAAKEDWGQQLGKAKPKVTFCEEN